MRPPYPMYPTWPPVTPYYRPRNPGEGALPLILVSVFGIATAANGLCIMLGVSFILCLVMAAVLYGFKLYFLMHRQPRIERTPDNHRYKIFTYLILTVMLLILMPFGLYGYGQPSQVEERFRQPPETQPTKSEDQSQVSRLNATAGDFNWEKTNPAAPKKTYRNSLAPESDTKLLDRAPDEQNDKSFFGFLSATGKKDTYAIICWIVAGVIEVITLILALRDLRSDYYDWD